MYKFPLTWYICKKCSATFPLKDQLILHKKKRQCNAIRLTSTPACTTPITIANRAIINSPNDIIGSKTTEDEAANTRNQNDQDDRQKNHIGHVDANIAIIPDPETQYYDESRSHTVLTPNSNATSANQNDHGDGDHRKNHIVTVGVNTIAATPDSETDEDESRSHTMSTPNVHRSCNRLLEIKLQRLSPSFLEKYITSSSRCVKEASPVPVAGSSNSNCEGILNAHGSSRSVNHHDITNTIVKEDNEESANSSEQQTLTQEENTIFQAVKCIPPQSDVKACISLPPLPQMEKSVMPVMHTDHFRKLATKLLKRARHGKKKHHCNDCNKSFSQIHHWVEHVQVHLKKSHNCSLCSKTFSTRVALKTHLKLHIVQEKLHSCKQCNKKYFDINNLEKHAETHEKEKPYSCDFCGQKFLSDGGLKIHVKKLHDSKDSYSCTYCGKILPSNSSLKKHIHVHDTNKSFTCNYCGKTFSHSMTLRHHHIKMHGDLSYACYRCGKSLSSSKEVKRHIYVMHQAPAENKSIKVRNGTPEKKRSIKIEQIEKKTGAKNNTVTKNSRSVIKKECIKVSTPTNDIETGDRKRNRPDTKKTTKQLTKVQNTEKKTKQLTKVQNTEKKTKQLVKLENAGTKMKQLVKLENTGTKMKQLRKLENTGMKAKQLVKLENAGTKMKQLGKLNVGKKTKQLVKLENVETKTKLVQLENPGKKTKLPKETSGNTTMKIKVGYIQTKNKQIGLKNSATTCSENQKYFCSFCEKAFSSKSNMQRHMLSLQGTCSKKRFSCNLCGKRFAIRLNMLKHATKHTNSV